MGTRANSCMVGTPRCGVRPAWHAQYRARIGDRATRFGQRSALSLPQARCRTAAMKLPEALPRQPFIGVACAAIAGILLADSTPHPHLGALAAVILAIAAFLRRSSAITHAFVFASFFCMHSLRQTDTPGLRLARELGDEPVAIAARGVVVSEPKISASGTASFHFRTHTIEKDGQARACEATLLARWAGEVRYGDELQLFGVVSPNEPPRNPGEFDMRDYLARRDIYHALVVRYPENARLLSRGGGNPVMRGAQASRKWMQAALARGLEDSPDLHSLISGMVLGVRDETPDEIEEQFQQTGTLHLFAVSGLNVAIVAHLLWIVATTMRIPRRWAIGLIIPALFFYAAITGLNPSSVRAALMAAVCPRRLLRRSQSGRWKYGRSRRGGGSFL